MGFCKSNQKSIPVVGFLTRNDCDVLRAKTGGYRRFTHRTIILPTPVWLTHYSSHGPWVVVFFLLGKIPTVIPRGLQGLGLKGGIGVLAYPHLHMTHPPVIQMTRHLHPQCNATPPRSLSLLVTSAQEHLPTCCCFPPSTVSPKGMQSRVGSVGVLVGWERVLGES